MTLQQLCTTHVRPLQSSSWSSPLITKLISVCRPALAVLDECTNATSLDVEHQLYEHARSLHITIITVTQRPALTSLHQQELKLLDGRGHWQLCNLIPSDSDTS
jgi:ABC-type uncharacterized transport system fused permease/ATPase subunit